jgi:trehalose-phosphatase
VTGWDGTGRGGLIDRIAAVAQSEVLLVGCDFDGTLAPIVDDPASARAIPESLVSLQRLAQLRQTRVAVVSGRSLADLATLTPLPPEVVLVGSHGAEMEPRLGDTTPPEVRDLAHDVSDRLQVIADSVVGARLERKPIGAALHYRQVADDLVDGLLGAVLDGPGALPDVVVKHGKKVVELCVVTTDKGTALRDIADRIGATATVFIGDDVTDEDAFAALGPADLGVKVGPGESIAIWRVSDPVAVSHLLSVLYEARHAHVTPRRSSGL